MCIRRGVGSIFSGRGEPNPEGRLEPRKLELFPEKPTLVDFLFGHAPAPAWGSRDSVLAWTTTPDRLEI